MRSFPKPTNFYCRKIKVTKLLLFHVDICNVNSYSSYINTGMKKMFGGRKKNIVYRQVFTLFKLYLNTWMTCNASLAF